MNDPFSPEADPDPPRPRLSRRDLLVLVLAPTATTTVVAATTGCVTPRLACAPRADDAHACQHRFCRYFRGPER